MPEGQAPLLLSVHDTGSELTGHARITVTDVQTQGWRAATGWRTADAGT